jgi:hypothetical protein
MNELPTTPATQPANTATTPSVLIGSETLPRFDATGAGLSSSPGIVKTLLRRWAFVALRAAVIGIIGWLARHNLGFVANVLGGNVDALVTGACGLAIVGCHELDLMVTLHPELLPAKCRIIWAYFHPTAKQTLPTVADGKGGFVSIRGLLTGMAVAIVLIVLAGAFTGCSTVKADAKAVEHQILVDGRAVGKTLVADGQQFVQLTIDGLNAYRTNADFRASVDKDIANAAVVAAKVP